jgi:hypothetical protein
LAAGAHCSFWLRTKQGFLAEGLPLLREALAEIIDPDAAEPPTLILESNSVLQFVQPSLYFAVIDARREDFKDSARIVLDRADALVLRGAPQEPAEGQVPWLKLPSQLSRHIPSVRQLEGEPLPPPLQVLVRRVLEAPPDTPV